MGYEIRYSKLEDLTEAQKEERAIADLYNWFTVAQRIMIDGALDGAVTMQDVDSLDMAIGIGGVTGYPVRCLFAKKWGWPFVKRWSMEASWGADTTIASVLAELEGQ